MNGIAKRRQWLAKFVRQSREKLIFASIGFVQRDQSHAQLRNKSVGTP